jgi:two-component system sensor histidine kinase DegS
MLVRAYSTGNLRPPEAEEAPGLTSLEELLEAVRSECDQLERDIEEIRSLVRQTNTELERSNQRKAEMMQRVREMEARLETFARQEIRSTYLAASDADKRVFMMQGERDRLLDKQKAYERSLRFLQRVLNTILRLQHTRQQSEEADPAVAHVARLVQAQEQLRQRIAQRLHDGPVQALTNVVMKVNICERMIDHNRESTRSELTGLKDIVNATLQETRKFIAELRPMTLDDLGLIPTLKGYAQDLTNRNGVQVHFVLQGPEQRLPPSIEVSLFRIAQEALSNVIAHAQATQAVVSLYIHERGATLTIEDDGRGFDVERALDEATANKTVGLTNMYERAEMLKTRLAIESVPGRGTKVELTVPRQGASAPPL